MTKQQQHKQLQWQAKKFEKDNKQRTQTIRMVDARDGGKKNLADPPSTVQSPLISSMSQ